MAEQLDKVYDPATIEKQVNEFWSSAPFFHADASRDGDKAEAYTIVIPPPNVTAALHLGHALNNTLQDILIRFRRMQQRNTLWMPGTDHAGIATQTVVEKRILAEEGKRRTELDPDLQIARQKFVTRVQAWKDEYEATILAQLKAMGCSCDWQRTRFTMDDVCAKAVRANFFNLFKDGLIYRGKRLVNWDPATQTVLADDEVEHETVKGHFWYLRYPLVESVAGVSPARAEGILPSNENEEPEINKRHGRYLPHWSKEGAIYAITFRLVDAVPAEVSESWRFQRRDLIERAQPQARHLSAAEQIELQRLHSEKIEAFLDAGHGQCLLRDPELAQIVQHALKHFDGERYELIAWAVMPNHVHAIVRPLPGHELPKLVHSWKSFTAKDINQHLGRQGTVWMDEYYDHLIRDEKDFINQVEYVLANPENAGLEDWAWCGVGEERGQDALGTRGRDARDTSDTITYVTVATTRPETMLGDTAVAMNPADPRAAALVGKMVRLPIVGRLIPIIADEHIVLPNPESEDEKARFSTGFLKVTPAHDPDDWAIGERHNLEVINVMAPDGSISDKYGWNDATEPEARNLLGMDRFEAREAIVEWFRQENLLEDVRDYTHEVGHSYRSHVPIEPYLSDQWYIAVKKPIDHLAEKFGSGLIEGTDVPVNSLAGLALKPLLDGRLRFIPERYAKTYQTWLENLRDWPISRQLWWGHRIPVWSFKLSSALLGSSGGAYNEGLEAKAEETKKDFDRLMHLCGLAEEVSSYMTSPTDDDPITRYLVACGRTLKADKAFDLLNRILNHSNQIDFDTVCQENQEFRDEFGVDAFNQLGLLTASFSEIGQDNDVLDTWFSSALWPFSTLGWPDETPEMKAFYPGSVLCTAREIITLWVSRMVMMGQYCAGDIPFFDVYIHAMIQDGEGRKMSKSLGNGIDPLVAIDSHGADAMRFTLASMATDTQDIRMPVAPMTLPDGREVNTSPKFDIGRNFCNKLWNASRFAMMNLEGLDPAGFDASRMDVTDKWILSRLASTQAEVTASLDAFKFSEPMALLYRFFWNDFCDWYLEWAKGRMRDDAQRPIAQNVLAFVLDRVLRLLHPFVPFITEGIFQKLNELAPVRALSGIVEADESQALAVAQWPVGLNNLINKDAEERIRIVQEIIRAIRDIRNKYNKAPNEKMSASADAPTNTANMLNGARDLICPLAGLTTFRATTNAEKPNNAATAIVEETQVYLHDVIDPQAERTRLEKQKQEIEQAKKGVEGKLANENFVTRAKPEVVAQARERSQQLQEQLQAVEKHLAELEG
ncbi:MAG: valine--tRNA ligase [Sedimentisphaerales bacterium]|nr:valine--tRNA ligase [Sedimentisphaerales bacterium]